MQTATVTRKPSARAYDASNKRVTVSVGDQVKTAFGKGRIERISDYGYAALHVRICDPRKHEHGNVVTVRSIR
jgi:hypothetical protein